MTRPLPANMDLPPRTLARWASEDHSESLLDRALEGTFPASDPVPLTLVLDSPLRSEPSPRIAIAGAAGWKRKGHLS
jgi:hypothetical protein